MEVENRIVPESIVTDDVDIRGSVFVVPLDAPMPSELGEVAVPKGNLYTRISALASPLPELDFAIVPIAGNELLALDRVWSTIVEAPRVYVLAEIPGAKYDILFNQARRQLGLRTLDWPSISDALESRMRTVQRTKDTEPWNLADQGLTPSNPKRKYNGSNLDEADRALPLPEEDLPDED